MMITRESRYTAASNEISARIQARNRTLTQYFGFTAVLLGIAIRGEGFAIVGLATAYLALVMVVITFYHEAVIRCLMEFQWDIAIQGANTKNNYEPE